MISSFGEGKLADHLRFLLILNHLYPEFVSANTLEAIFFPPVPFGTRIQRISEVFAKIDRKISVGSISPKRSIGNYLICHTVLK